VAVVWRFLFEKLQYSLLSSLRHGDLSTEDTKLREFASMTALSGAADVLRTADIASDPDADTIWRVWDNLFLPSSRERIEHLEAWNRLQRIHDELSACVVAWLLYEVVRIEHSPNEPRHLLETTQRRLFHLEDQRSIVDRISEMVDVDESTASSVWARWTREQMPEWEVVRLESLRTGLLRLLILSVITTGGLQPGKAQQWIRLIQDDEVRALTGQVVRAFEVSGIPVAATTESVLEYFRSMRRLAARAHAMQTQSRPISQAIVSTIRTSAMEGWREARELPAVLATAGCSISEAHLSSEITSRVPRTFLIEDPEAVGQERWIGAEFGRGIARLEMALAVQDWMEHSEATPEDSSMERVLEQMGDREPLMLLLPIDWRTEAAARENRVLLEAAVKMVSTPAIPDGTALLIWAAEESWQVGSPENLSLGAEDQELSPDDEDAYVLLRIEYGMPQAVGPVQVFRLNTEQIASDRHK
jgi:hypothetical protein